MDRDKKRSSLPSWNPNGELTLSTMVSSYLPYAANGSSAATSRTRPSTPPASTYFTTYAEDPDQEPIPTPGAQTHFAFSSTLVRRQPDSPILGKGNFHPLSPVEGLVDRVLGKERELGIEDGRARPPAPPPSHKEVTSSSKFAHMTIEVSSVPILIRPVCLA